MSTLFLKKVDQIIGSLMARLLPRSAPSSSMPRSLSRLLLIRPGGIGDAVLVVPTIRALKKFYPGVEVIVLAERRNGAVFRLCPDVSQVLLYDDLKQFLAAMRQRYDVVIDSEQWHRLSAVVARIIRSKLKIGFGTNERKRLFNFAATYAHADYETASFMHLLEPLGGGDDVAHFPFLKVSQEYARKIDGLLEPFSGQSLVALFPGASIAERRWGGDNFHRLAVRLNGLGFAVVVVGGSQDEGVGNTILSDCHGINLAGKTSLVETAAVLQRSRLLVSGDSGVLHLAVGLDVATVSLFGPGIAAKWAPRGNKHIVLNKNLPCSPCTRFGYTPPCPEGGRCIQEIGVDQVVEAVEALLNSTNN